MKKRLVALVLCIVMMFSLVSVQAFADTGSDGSVSVTTTAKKVEVGKTFDVTIKVTPNGVAAGAVNFTVALSAGLEYVSHQILVSTSDYMMSNYDVATGVFGCAVTTNGKSVAFNVLKLTLKAKDTNVGENSISLTNVTISNVAGDANLNYATTVAPVTVTTSVPVVAVTSVTVSSKTLNLEVGQTRTLTATVKPDNATDKTVTWTSSNDKVATVVDGTVAAVGEGTATITATAANGKKDTCKVTVKVPVCNHSEDKLTHVDGKAATCTEAGVKEHYLCKCGTKLDLDKKTVLATTVIPATGHKTEKEENKATCAKLAVCDVCGESYGSLKKHTVVKVDKVDPTCNTPGVKAHYECSVCGKWFSDKNGTKEIAEADKASYVIPVDPDMHVYDIVKDSYKEYDEGYYVEQFQCTKCGDSYWLASVDLRNVDVKLVQDGKGDLKNAKVEVASTSVKTKEVMSLYYNDTANAGDTLSLPVFFNYSKSATEAEAIAALKKDIAENSTFTVKAAATKSGWKFTTDKTYTVTVELDDAGKVVTKWVGSDNTEVSAEDTPTFTITGKKTTGGGNGGSGNGGSTTTDTTKNDGKKVESGKTFDAGIAMYVGLSVLSVTGGALVIGKKKERF